MGSSSGSWRWPENGDVDAELCVRFNGESVDGGFGSVYFGIHTARQKVVRDYRELPLGVPEPVAVKFWNPTSSNKHVSPALFLIDLVHNQKTAHPNLTKVITWRRQDTTTDRPLLYVMPRLDLSLEDLVLAFQKTGKSLPQEKFNQISAGLSKGIIKLHSAKVVHNDLKLNNILIEFTDEKPLLNDRTNFDQVCEAVVHRSLRAVICDLGVAQCVGDDAYPFGQDDEFKHPEQCFGNQARPDNCTAKTKFDIFAYSKIIKKLVECL